MPTKESIKKFFSKKKKEPKKPETPKEKIIEFFRQLFFAAIAALFIITFIIQNTRIPTGSMIDTILVGEMRDNETASMGIQASLTGHLVFSTLHTNDAPSAVTRMVDMGVPGYMVASSVIAILAQRLVRVNCPKCNQPFTPSQEVLRDAGITPEMAAGAKFMKGKGCGNCQKNGYRGRLGIFELMIVTSKIRELMFEGCSTQEIRTIAIAQGMNTLYQDGIDKVLNGITTFDEVYRVSKRTEQDDMGEVT